MRTRPWSEWHNPQAGFLALIEILIVVLIIAALAAYFLTSGSSVSGGGQGGGRATTTPGKATEEAESTVCRNNLSQLRAAVGTYSATTGSYPPDLDSLEGGVPRNCPVSGEAYVYDATTGQVSCPYPPHEGY